MEQTGIFNDKNNTLLLGLENPVMWQHGHDASCMGFHAKNEYHMTVLGHKAGKIISNALKEYGKVLEELFLKAVLECLETYDEERWVDVTKNCEMRIIEKHYNNGSRKSLIYMLKPHEQLIKFHHKMEALFPGIGPHLPIPHVTIGVDGDHPGIGLTQHVWDNELTSNFLVANPGYVKELQTKVKSLEKENYDLEYQIQNHHSYQCSECGQYDCNGECDYS